MASFASPQALVEVVLDRRPAALSRKIKIGRAIAPMIKIVSRLTEPLFVLVNLLQQVPQRSCFFMYLCLLSDATALPAASYINGHDTKAHTISYARRMILGPTRNNERRQRQDHAQDQHVVQRGQPARAASPS